MNYHIKLAVQSDLNPITAIQMATINTANCPNLTSLGATLASYQADLLILSNLKNFYIEKVLKRGKVVVNNGKKIETAFTKKEKIHFDSPKIRHHFTKKDLNLSLKENKAHVMGISQINE